MSNFLYKIAFNFLKGLLHLVFPFKTEGMEKLPEGGCLLCGNHTHFADPLFIVFSLKSDRQYGAMGKEELFKNKLFAAFFRFAGVFPVSRGKHDISAIRVSLDILKKGKKLILFPEGTRVKPGMTVKPKTGAVRIAHKTKKPIVPIYIPRRKTVLNLFKPIRVIYGEPYIPLIDDPNDYEQLTAAAEDLMNRIRALEAN